MNLDVSYGAALIAGGLSFLSPCVLPLVPPYLVYISGTSLNDLQNETGAAPQRQRALVAAMLFVLGFSTIFVLLGAGASAAGQLLRTHLGLLAQIAGVFIIIMGLNFLGVFRLGILGRELRYHSQSQTVSLFGAYLVGVAFAFGWTPCIGPILAAILTIAASEQDVAKGASLLAVYSLGLGVPFLLSAAGVGTFLSFFARFKKHLPWVERSMGALLVVTGVMFLTGAMQNFSYWLIERFPALANIG
jgi:cytochrome c-type biogenesis protein